MKIGIAYGDQHLELDVNEQHLIGVERGPSTPDLTDSAAAVREALETPRGFPALRRALTPDDHLALVVDEHLPQLAGLVTAVLEHVSQAHVQPEAITLVCPPPDTQQTWLEELPATFQEVRVEVHNPTERKRLSYLATTREGRRVYLNRTVVDADQVVVLTRRTYSPLFGYAGAAGALFPALSDEATRDAAQADLSLDLPGKAPWPWQKEAAEVAWLLGAPFLVQVIEGSGDRLAHVLGGPVETSAEGQRLLNERWRVTVARPADVVVAAVAGTSGRQEFADLARAAQAAARVVKRNGRIILLSCGAPPLGEAVTALRSAEDPAEAFRSARANHRAADQEAAFAWASAAEQARISLLSDLPAETVEELFAVPLDNAGQVQRLLHEGGSFVFLPDAHRTLAVLRD